MFVCLASWVSVSSLSHQSFCFDALSRAVGATLPLVQSIFQQYSTQLNDASHLRVKMSRGILRCKLRASGPKYSSNPLLSTLHCSTDRKGTTQNRTRAEVSFVSMQMSISIIIIH